jgi:acyl-coenzyme A synthetase/AMP-(fatty) acid ligase
MAQFQNIAEQILDVATERGDRPAVILPDRQISYARFRQLVLDYAQHAILHGIGRGSLVAIDMSNVVMHSALSLACALAGASWVTATPAVIRQRRIAWTHLLFGAKKSHKESATQILVDETWSVTPPGRAAAFTPAGPDDIWNYSMSSGTTGESKFIPFTFRSAQESLKRATGLPEGMRPVVVSLAPEGSPTSLPFGILAVGGTAVFAGGNYDLMLQSGTNLVGGSPVQYAKLLENAKPSDKRIYMAATFGAAMNQALLARMLDFFERVKIMYGTTEVGIVSERIIESLPYDPSNVGKVLPPAELEIVDDNDRPVPAGVEGIVRMRRADIPWKGYTDADDATRSQSRDGWFYPGDIGRFSKEGELFFVGRRDDRLNLGGTKVDADRVDAIIQDTAGVRDGYCFDDRGDDGVNHLALLLALDVGMRPETIVQNIYRALNAAGLFHRIKRVYLSGEIPRTETGKPLRRLAPEFVRKLEPINIALRTPR